MTLSTSAEITLAANAQVDELVALADEKGALLWKALEWCYEVALCA